MDENLTPEGEKQVEVQQEEQHIEVDPIAERARAAGWAPKEEYEGDPAKWVDAGEFLRRGELFEKIDKQNRRIKDLDKSIADLRALQAKTREVEYARALADIKAHKKSALEEGDTEKFLDLEEQEKDIREQRTQAQAEQAQVYQEVPEEHPQFTAWKDRNSWYENDPDLRAFADGYGQSLRGSGTPDQILAKVSARVREVFPDKFKSKAADSGNQVMSGTRASKTGTVKYVPTDEERRVAERFARLGVMTKEEYYKSLANLDKGAS